MRSLIAQEDLDWLLLDLDLSPHVPVAPKTVMRKRMRSTKVELKSQEVVDWPDPRKKKVKRKKSKNIGRKKRS